MLKTIRSESIFLKKTALFHERFFRCTDRLLNLRFLLVFAFIFVLQFETSAITYYSRASGNWDGKIWATTNNGAANFATITDADNVVIQVKNNVSVNISSAVCKNIDLGTNNNIAVLTFNSGSKLAVSGIVTLGNSGNTNRRGRIVMTAGGTLECQGLALGNTGSNNFTYGTGTVILTANNTIPATVFTNFYNLSVNAGTTNISANTTVNNNLYINDGATFNAPDFSLTVSGTTTVGGGSSGTLNISGATGTKTFTGNVTLNNGSTWNESAAATVSYGGNLTNNSGTFTAGTGNHSFTGTSKILSGSSDTSIPNIIVSGSYTNSGILTAETALTGSGSLANSGTLNLSGSGSSSITTLSNSGTIHVTGSGAITTALANFTNTGTINLGGSGLVTGITNNGGAIVNLTNASQTIGTFNNATSTSTLNISALINSTSVITTLTATVSGNTVNYNGSGNQTVKNTGYSNLIISGGGNKSLGGATTVSGTLTLTSGYLITTLSNSLTVTNTSASAISGGSATSFIDGSVQWNLPTLASGTTYQFPVGKGGTYLPFSLVNPTTTGASSAKVEAFSSNSGGSADETTLQSINSTEYWSLVTGSNFSNCSVTLGKSTAIYPSDAVGGCTSVNGIYTSLLGTTNVNSVSNSNAIGTLRFFTLASRTNYWVGNLSNDWNTSGNWSVGHIPASGQNIEFADGNNYVPAAQNDLNITSNIIINKLKNLSSKAIVIYPEKTLTVNSTITTLNNTDQIYIKADTLLANGSLIYQTTQPSPVYGTVEMWSQSSWDTSPSVPAGQRYNWQFFGIPVDTVKASPTVNGAYIRYRDEAGNDTTSHWHSLTNSSNIIPFTGYELCFQTPRIISFKGKLVNRNFNSGQLARTTSGGVLYAGQHILANPYTAAIDIRQITFGSDMEQSVYLYNTGTFAQWNAGTAGKIGSTPGQYTAVPQNLAGESGIQSQVPSMNSMLVQVISSTPNAYVIINYNSVITANTERQRIKSAANGSSKYVSTRIEVESKNGIDKMWLFAGEQMSRKYDNGYDAKKMTGSSLHQQIYAVEEDGDYQIDATDNYNNTNIAFLAGQEQDYKMSFFHANIEKKYSGLYLFDMVENKIIEITGNGTIYNFKANPTPEAVTRFKIIAKPEVAVNVPESNIVYFNIKNTLYLYNRANEAGNISLYDISGREINHTKIPANGMTSLFIANEKIFILKSIYSNSSESHKILIR